MLYETEKRDPASACGYFSVIKAGRNHSASVLSAKYLFLPIASRAATYVPFSGSFDKAISLLVALLATVA